MTKSCWKSSYISVFILSKKRRNWFHKNLYNSGMVGGRKLSDPSLNHIFNALSIGVQYTISFQLTNFGLKCLCWVLTRCYIFPDGSVWLMDNLWRICDVWKGRSYVNFYVSVSSIFNNGQFYFQYYSQKSLLPNTVLYIHSTWRTSQSPPKNVPYCRQQMTSTRRHLWAYFLKCFSISLFFQYWL